MRGKLIAVDGKQDHFIVENLEAPLGVYKSAVLRRSDIISMEFSLSVKWTSKNSKGRDCVCARFRWYGARRLVGNVGHLELWHLWNKCETMRLFGKDLFTPILGDVFYMLSLDLVGEEFVCGPPAFSIITIRMPPQFKCETCGMMLSSAGNLKVHMVLQVACTW